MSVGQNLIKIGQALEDGCQVYSSHWDNEVVEEVLQTIRIYPNILLCSVAHSEGKQIEWRGPRTNYRWELLRGEPVWSEENAYRVATVREPIPFTNETFDRSLLNKKVTMHGMEYEINGLGNEFIYLNMIPKEGIYGNIGVSFKKAFDDVTIDGKRLADYGNLS